jgi:thioredoxin 1
MITQDNFDQWLAKDARPKAVLLWQKDCPACAGMFSVLKNVSKAWPQIDFLGLNAAANPKIRQRIITPGLPTLVLFENGEPKTSLIGYTEAENVEKWLKDRVSVQTGVMCEFCASIRDKLRPYLPRLMKRLDSYAR